ncbi:MAG TPA: histidine phosphatase family protein [Acidimicrobiales bacterium]|nr:histidine phosphatase family protein [Acidimicrobiales bacterium]
MTDQAFEPDLGAFVQEKAGTAPGTRLAIVRHGEAVCNVEDFIGGHEGCRGLTKRGVRQAEALAERLRRTGELAGAAALWTSVLPRAVETAEIIAPSLRDLPVQRSCGLCERHPGEADGLTWAEYERRYLRISLPGDDPELPLSPGGESWIDFVDRASASLAALAADHPGQLLVVVAHGGVIDASVIRFLGLPDHGENVRLHPDHTSITEWEHTGTRWRFARYNDAAHLGGPEVEELRSPAPGWVGRDQPD